MSSGNTKSKKANTFLKITIHVAHATAYANPQTVYPVYYVASIFTANVQINETKV